MVTSWRIMRVNRSNHDLDGIWRINPLKDHLFQFHAIGYVKNDFNSRCSADELKSAISCLSIEPNLRLGLEGIEVGQKIMVIFYFDRSEGYELLQHPRGDLSRPKRGVFSLRSPNRPNKIGVCIVDVEGIEGNILWVKGLRIH